MKPGVPDATAHRPRPQSLDCLTALPRLWIVVVTIDSLYRRPCRNACLRGKAAQPGPRGRSRRPAIDRFSTCRNFATSMESRTPASWLEVAGRGRQLSPARVESPTIRLLRILRPRRPVEFTVPDPLFIRRPRSFSGGHLFCGLTVPRMGLVQARITRSRGS
jgi:hypothetical protein